MSTDDKPLDPIAMCIADECSGAAVAGGHYCPSHARAYLAGNEVGGFDERLAAPPPVASEPAAAPAPTCEGCGFVPCMGETHCPGKMAAPREGHLASFCPECGWDVHVDEDGCCRFCGATALGDAVDELAAERAASREGAPDAATIDAVIRHFQAFVDADGKAFLNPYAVWTALDALRANRMAAPREGEAVALLMSRVRDLSLWYPDRRMGEGKVESIGAAVEAMARENATNKWLLDRHDAALRDVKAARDKLAAEVERLTRERDEAREAVDVLQAGRATLATAFAESSVAHDKLAAEVTRLRAALAAGPWQPAHPETERERALTEQVERLTERLDDAAERYARAVADADAVRERLVGEAARLTRERDEKSAHVDKLQRTLDRERISHRNSDAALSTLLAKHGGEPLALLRELDAARAEVARLTAELATARMEAIEEVARHVKACTATSTAAGERFSAAVLVAFIVDEIRALSTTTAAKPKETP